MTALSAMLDELMGRDRNAAPNEKRAEIRWDDDDVCKHFLCGFCPAELFTNTRSDLGACDKSHDDHTRKAYQNSSRYMKMGYEEEFLQYLQHCWLDVERRIRRNHQRLQLSEEKNKSNALVGNAEVDEKITVLNERITDMLTKIEELGGQGEVEQAQSMMKLCDQLKIEREELHSSRGGRQIMDQFAVQEKQMEVCEVCGAFLIVGDAQSRVDDHLMGKQHMGYAKIKSMIAELKDKLVTGPPAAAPAERTSERNGRPSPREREMSKTRDRGSDRDGDRKTRAVSRSERHSRDRGASRDHRGSSRDRRGSSRDRRGSSRDHRGSSRDRRGSSRERRDRDRDRHGDRDRDRERRRESSRDRDRGKRRSSRDRDRRGSSRDRRKSRDRDRKSSPSRDRRSDADRSSRRKRSRDRERSKSRDRDGHRKKSRRSEEKKSDKHRRSSHSERDRGDKKHKKSSKDRDSKKEENSSEEKKEAENDTPVEQEKTHEPNADVEMSHDEKADGEMSQHQEGDGDMDTAEEPTAGDDNGTDEQQVNQDSAEAVNREDDHVTEE